MAATKKTAKRSAAKKAATAKRPSSKKQPARKGGKKSAPQTTGLKRRARKGLKAARGSLGSVLQAGKKTWKKLKITTAKVMG